MQKSENEILLHLGETGWLATFVGPHAAKLVEAFGQTTIPTAWTSAAPLADVIAGVALGNPGASVKHWLGWTP